MRKRPSMYLESSSCRGLYHLVYGIVDKAIDEALAKFMPNIIDAMSRVYSQSFIRRMALRRLGFQYSEQWDAYYMTVMKEPPFLHIQDRNKRLQKLLQQRNLTPVDVKKTIDAIMKKAIA